VSCLRRFAGVQYSPYCCPWAQERKGKESLMNEVFTQGERSVFLKALNDKLMKKSVNERRYEWQAEPAVPLQ
jgi:hypothetical protein